MYKVLSILSACGAGIISISLISSQASANTYAKTSGLIPEVEVSNTVREEVIEIERDFETLEVVEKMSDIEYLIRTKAREAGVNEETALRIAKCESSLNPEARNSNKNKTNDLGLFQINSIHGVADNCRLDPVCNVSWSMETMKKQGFKPWNASKHCWGDNQI